MEVTDDGPGIPEEEQSAIFGALVRDRAASACAAHLAADPVPPSSCPPRHKGQLPEGSIDPEILRGQEKADIAFIGEWD